MPTQKISDFLNQVKGYGFTAIGFGILGVFCFLFGFKLLAGVSFGVFFTRNWDILVEYFNEYRDDINI